MTITYKFKYVYNKNGLEDVSYRNYNDPVKFERLNHCRVISVLAGEFKVEEYAL